jgi:hypothetical protein|tara:strand:- start:344 stop:1195 length:852 start_codon:yes stop_codon:yes gene_type:complete
MIDIQTSLAGLSSEDINAKKQEFISLGDLQGLKEIMKYKFINGSAAVNEYVLPEMSYYFGRLHAAEELMEFITGKEFYLLMLPNDCKLLAEKLMNIGYLFPNLNSELLDYLEEKYCDRKTFEIIDNIMFDAHLLPRKLKKFDKELLKIKNNEFSDNLCFEVYEAFSKNQELDYSCDDFFVYDKIENKIIKINPEKTGQGQYVIDMPLSSKDFWILLNQEFDEMTADNIIKKLCFDEPWEDFKNYNCGLDSDNITKFSKEVLKNEEELTRVKISVAKHWLLEVN